MTFTGSSKKTLSSSTSSSKMSASTGGTHCCKFKFKCLIIYYTTVYVHRFYIQNTVATTTVW